MVTYLLAFALSSTVHGQDLRARLRPRTCAEIFSHPYSPEFARRLRRQLDEDGAALIPVDGALSMLANGPKTPSKRDAVDRASVVDAAIGLLAEAGPPPFVNQSVAYADWQMDLWPAVTRPPTRRCCLLADRLFVPPEVRELDSGEFVVAVRFDRELPPAVIEDLVELSLGRIHVDRRFVKGVASYRTYHSGHLYLTLDIPAKPAVRFRQTLRLMNALNDELTDLGVRLF